MNIEIKDYGEILNIQSNAEGGDIYTISVVFINTDVMTYGYTDKKRWLKDYNDLSSLFNRRSTHGDRDM